MKTKYLLMTMALPAVFAACVNDDFMEQSAKPVADDGRRSAGEVVIVPSFAKDADTRLDWVSGSNGYGPKIEPGFDQIGAAQIDEYSSNHWPHFMLSNDINTNYNFWLEESDGMMKWKASSPLTEGNYIFYMNYDDQMMGRGTMYDEVDPVQYAKDREGKYDAYGALDNQFFMGYDFLEAEDSKKGVNEISPRLTAIHSMIRVRAHYTDNGQVKIKKIAIRKAGSLQDLKNYFGSYTNGSITYAPMTTKVDVKPLTTHMATGFLDEACMANNIYQLKKNKDGVTISGENAETLEDYDALMQSLVYPNWEEENLTYQYELNFPDCEEATLGNGEYAEGWILMPTANFQFEVNKDHVDDATGEAAKMVLAIYTDKGMFEVPMSTDNVDLSGVISNVRVNGDLESLKPGKAAYFDVYFDNAAASNAPKTFTVNNTTDLLEQLKMYEGTDAEVTLFLYSAGDDVRMTQEVYDILAAKANIKLTLEAGQLIINRGITPKDGKSPVNLIYLDDEYEGASLVKKIWEKYSWDVVAPVVVVEGDYTAENFNYVGKSGKTLGNLIQEAMQEKVPIFGDHLLYNDIALPAIKVAEGAKLTVNGPIAARVEVAEGGELVVSGEENIGLLSLANFGKADINNEFRAFHVFNGAGATLNINADVEFSLYNDRDVKMDENCCLDDENAFTWVWGKVNIAKDAEAYLFGLEYMGRDQKWYGNWGIIKNDGVIKAGHPSNDFVNEPDEVVYCINSGRIENNGTIYDLYNNGYVDNNGTLYLAKTTEWSYIDVTNNYKDVIRPNANNEDSGAQYVLKVASAATATTYDELPASVTTLVVAGETVVEKANSTVSLIILQNGAGLKGTFSNPDLKVVAEKESKSNLNGVTLTGKLWISSGATVNVAENSTLNNIYIAPASYKEGIKETGVLEVLSQKNLTYTGKIDNYGKVNVLGTAKASETGSYNEFTDGEWNGNNDPRPLVTVAVFRTLLKSQVENFITNSYTNTKVEFTLDDFTSSEYYTDELKEKEHQSEVVLADEFNNLLAQLKSENKAKLIQAFAGKTSDWQDITVYANAAAAYKNFKNKIASGEVEGSIDALLRYSASELTDEEVAAILEDYAPYRYIWTGNELDDVLKVIANGWGQWADALGTEGGYTLSTIAGVKLWLTDAAKTNNSNEYALAAKAIANKYLSDFSAWGYSDAQVQAFGYNK